MNRQRMQVKTLKRTIPSRIESFTFVWVRKFQNYGVHKGCRDRMKMSVPKTCFWCRRKWQEEDQTWLTAVDGKGNKMVCESCATLIGDNSTEEGD